MIKKKTRREQLLETIREYPGLTGAELSKIVGFKAGGSMSGLLSDTKIIMIGGTYHFNENYKNLPTIDGRSFGCNTRSNKNEY